MANRGYKFYSVFYKDRIILRNLAPKSLLEELDQPGQYALAINGKGEYANIPVGTVIFYKYTDTNGESRIRIRWIYVEESQREKGYARALLDQLLEIALFNQVAEVRVCYPDTKDIKGMNALFYEMDLSYENDMYLEVFTTVKEVMRQETIREKLMLHKAVKPLKTISTEEFLKFHKRLSPDVKQYPDYILPENMEKYDGEVSCYIKENGSIAAMCLVRYIDGYFEPVIFRATGEKASAYLILMMSYSLMHIKEEYGEDTSIKLCLKRNNRFDFFMKLLPDLHFVPCIHGTMDNIQ